MQKSLRPYRRRATAEATGRVLEIGAGSGLNLPLYGHSARDVVALDPCPQLLERAAKLVKSASVPVELLQGSAEALPFESASFDTVVTTWTLCTVPDPGRALSEMRRVLRPDGWLLFVEHGKAPEPGVARCQNRLDPLWS